MKEDEDNICEECKKDEESGLQILIKHGYKFCDSCNTKSSEANTASS